MPDEVYIRGLDELEQKLRELSLVAQRQILSKAVKAGAEVIAEAASQRAPRDTGALAENIIHKIIGREATVDQVISEIGPEKSVFYGGFLETGTAHISARPWLRPALEDNKEKATEKAAEVLKQQIEKASR